jgi:hypothetical protein
MPPKEGPEFEPTRLKNQTLNEILSPRQQELVQRESEISQISLDPDGKIRLPEDTHKLVPRSVTDQCTKPGVIDAQSYDGALIMVYNSKKQTPEGAPDLFKKGRSGEYDPQAKTAYVDIADTYDYLDEKYQPQWVEQYARHEVRHHLVNIEDELRGEQRQIGMDAILSEDPDKAHQLAYLDELHSLYFDALDGETYGRNYFRTIDSTVPTTVETAHHRKAASTTETGQQIASEIFCYLQALILLSRMNVSGEIKSNINEIVTGAGTVLATERTLANASDKLKIILEKALKGNHELWKQFQIFVASYQPDTDKNKDTPEVTEEFKKVLGLK